MNIGVVLRLGYELKFDISTFTVSVINNRGQVWKATAQDIIDLALANGLDISDGEGDDNEDTDR